MTNKDLQYFYKYFNKRFFRNRLPIIPVKFGILPKDVLGRSHFGQVWKPLKITVSKKLKQMSSVAAKVMLHEMVHVSIGGVYYHGKRFWKEIDRLYKAGAYTRVRGGIL